LLLRIGAVRAGRLHCWRCPGSLHSWSTGSMLYLYSVVSKR
jgi:hypothetical protein